MKRIGLALGGGGARGALHVPVLQAFDACGIRPALISGTSIGAVIGALYAAGISGDAIRAHIEDHIITGSDHFRDILDKAPELFSWLGMVRINLGRGGFLKADGFLKYVFNYIKAETFEELALPLVVVATDFNTGETVTFERGDLRTAIRASMAIPGVFTPVVRDGRVLVDGGIADNVPYTLLQDRCDATVAVDPASVPPAAGGQSPAGIDAMLGMYDLLLRRITDGRLEKRPPDLFVRPGIRDVRVLEFNKLASVFEQADRAVAGLGAKLAAL